MPIIEPESARVHLVSYLQLRFNQALEAQGLRGLKDPEVEILDQIDPVQMAFRFQAAVLATQKEGKTFSEVSTFRFSAPRKPWWISKKRWARWKCDIIEVPRRLTVDVSQGWLMPNADLCNMGIGELFPIREYGNHDITQEWGRTGDQ
jgi:hypothetical protein